MYVSITFIWNIRRSLIMYNLALQFKIRFVSVSFTKIYKYTHTYRNRVHCECYILSINGEFNPLNNTSILLVFTYILMFTFCTTVKNTIIEKPRHFHQSNQVLFLFLIQTIFISLEKKNSRCKQKKTHVTSQGKSMNMMRSFIEILYMIKFRILRANNFKAII